MKITEQKEFKIVVKTFFGLEEVLAQEIRNLGVKEVTGARRAVECVVNKKQLYLLNYNLRTAIRILIPIENFAARDDKSFYNSAMKIDWEQYFGIDETFAIDCVSNSDIFKHSKFAALRLKDAIADSFREKYNKRPDVDVENPTVRFNLHIWRERVSISLDSSGQSLHKRGYRAEVGIAPLNEVLAAGLIQLSEWDKKSDFLDFMCGSGTLLIEAAMLAHNIPAQKHRLQFGFKNWNSFNDLLWNEVVTESKAKEISFNGNITGSDRDMKMITTCKRNIETAGLKGKIKVKFASFQQMKKTSENGIIICNPPYGQRIELNQSIEFHKAIGDALKQNFANWKAWIISSNLEALKYVGLRPSRKIPIMNGALECSYRKFEMYENSRKRSFTRKEN